MNALIDFLRNKCSVSLQESTTQTHITDFGFIFPDGHIDNIDSVAGAIRYAMRPAELDVHISAPVTNEQIKSIYRESRSKCVYYDIESPNGRLLADGTSFANLVCDINKYRMKISITESSVDFPSERLCASIWNYNNNTYTLRDDVKAEILSALTKYPAFDLTKIATKIRLVGSMASNTYSETADVDVHVVPEDASDWSDDDAKELMTYFEEQEIFFGSHPLEVYIQRTPDQDLMSDGCYNILEDKWEKAPTIRSMDYNPYENFKPVFDELSSRVKVADELMGKLKRDVIDYFTIEDVLHSLNGKSRQSAMEFLEQRLQEIEVDIQKLYKERKKWADARKFASKPSSPEEALKDIESAKTWADENAIFKFINRYQYIKVIGDLHAMLADGKLDDDDMQQIKKDIGVVV